MATQSWNSDVTVTQDTDLDTVTAFPPEDGVYGALFREGYFFDFYQAVRLLERYFPEAPAPGETSDVRRERIFFRPDTALVFPATDVKGVEGLDERNQIARMTLTFMGLYGIGSPLPVYFYDELAVEDRDTFPLRDFLDIFNHRLYSYFYRAWKKYRPEAQHRGGVEKEHEKRFLAVAGLGTPRSDLMTQLPNPMRLAAYAAWFSPQVRHADGLRCLISGLMPGIPVQVEENIPRWVPIPERPKMGAGSSIGMTLGSSATVGARIFDMSGQFRVVLGPITFYDYKAFLPGADKANLLDELVRSYAPDYLAYDVELHLDTSDIPPVRLGEKEVKLGLTTWLGKPKDDVTVQHVTYS